MLALTFLTLASFITISTAGYVLQDDYSHDSFFSMFDFFTDADPTHGYVTYVDQTTAQRNGLVNSDNGAIYMGVDNTNIASGSGRASVRLTSKKSYNHGLIILDLTHMPGGICGTWPAFWTVGPSWPNSGEIDIIEGVNSQDSNSVTLHTGSGCSISNTGLFSGRIATPNCDVNAAGQFNNAGCSISTSNKNTYGGGFNAAQGGVYATEWTGEAISVWFFPRNAIPDNIAAGNPDPSNWGMAMAHFSGGCDIDTHFREQQIVFDTTFCGDWAGNVWSADPVCSSKAQTCQSFVQNNPSEFKDAYWSVNSLKVYTNKGDAQPSNIVSHQPSSPQISVSVTATVPPPNIPEPTVISGPIPVPAGSTTIVPAGGQQTQTSRRRGGGRHTRTWGAVKDAAFFAVASPTNNPSLDVISPDTAERVVPTSVDAAVQVETATPSSSEANSKDDSSPMVLAVDGSAIVQVSVPTTTSIVNAVSASLVPSNTQQMKYVTVSALNYENFSKGNERRSADAQAKGPTNLHLHNHVHQHRHRHKRVVLR